MLLEINYRVVAMLIWQQFILEMGLIEFFMVALIKLRKFIAGSIHTARGGYQGKGKYLKAYITI